MHASPAAVAARSAAEEDAAEAARLPSALCAACVARAVRRGDAVGWHPACAAAHRRARDAEMAAHVPAGAGAAAYASWFVRRRHAGWGVDESVSPRVGAHQPPGCVMEVGPDWLDLTVRGGWLSAWGVGGETWDGTEPGMGP